MFLHDQRMYRVKGYVLYNASRPPLSCFPMIFVLRIIERQLSILHARTARARRSGKMVHPDLPLQIRRAQHAGA
jgi:hypothetical protein